MPVFAYTATDSAGRIVRGRYEGNDEAAVIERLQESGYDDAQLVLEGDDFRIDPIVEFTNSLIGQVIAHGASELRIEPQPENARILCRIGGVLSEQAELPGEFVAPLIARFKSMSNLQVHGRHYDLRVATSPTAHGERVDVVILPRI